ncbi:hypothetical protein BCF11_3374 [Collimonas sp. PA-H2]|uniref:hypothetical protein n=1 Tax=Collimonas sp. PA-H2 TaxID=1881062 RepID=UPI000C00EBF5|nr:hypothetical protein [Collimonas sp. PA-H2]PFH10938.1 hypothetical protein BCF11_3374 [Collimonas sp. PA-H2]
MIIKENSYRPGQFSTRYLTSDGWKDYPEPVPSGCPFLPCLLYAMTFPTGHSTKEYFANDDGPTVILRRFIDGQNYSKNNHLKPLPDHLYFESGSHKTRRLEQIMDKKTDGLQVGAALYALYWLSEKLGPTYATPDFAARMVTPPFCVNPTPKNLILKNLDEYSSVSHYWAAFFITIHPHNNLDKWKDDEPDPLYEDPLYDFVDKIDIATFLGHAATLLKFTKEYLHPSTGMPTSFSNRDKFTWLAPGPEICTSVEELKIPDLFGPEFPFEKFRLQFDASKEKARKYSATRYQSERSGKNK